MCRQCPGYRREVSHVLFATGSNYWLPGLPAPPPVPPPPKPAAEGSEKPTGEQPSTSSDIPSGDKCRLGARISSWCQTFHSIANCRVQYSVIILIQKTWQRVQYLEMHLGFCPTLGQLWGYLHILASISNLFLLLLCLQLLRSTAAPLRAAISSAPAASSQCQTDGPSSTASRLLLNNVSGPWTC